MNASSKLARQLYKDDLSRADEVPVARDGHRAYDGWLAAASEAGDTDTIDALEAADRDAFAAEWNRLVAEADESAAERAESDE